jgi:Predicted AAA-ATPase
MEPPQCWLHGYFLILHPRRFGKSLNLSMLKTFYSFGAESKEFSKFLIGKKTDFMEKYCGKYPVVLLNRKGVKGNNWQEMLIMIWSHLRTTLNELKNHLSELDLKYIGVDIYDPNARPNKMTAVDSWNP